MATWKGQIVKISNGYQLMTKSLQTKYYVVPEDFSSIRCLKCGNVSHNPNDVEQHYCSHCKQFHDDQAYRDWVFKETHGDPDPDLLFESIRHTDAALCAGFLRAKGNNEDDEESKALLHRSADILETTGRYIYQRRILTGELP